MWKNVLFCIGNLQHIKTNKEKQSLKALHFYNSAVTEK